MRKNKKTAHNNMKAIMVVLLMLTVMTIVWADWADAASHHTEHITTFTLVQFNARLANAVEQGNKVSQKHFGFDAMHLIKVITGTLTIDLNRRSFEHSTLSIEKQIDIMVDTICGGSLDDLRKMAVDAITVKVDGVVFKEYKIKTDTE